MRIGAVSIDDIMPCCAYIDITVHDDDGGFDGLHFEYEITWGELMRWLKDRMDNGDYGSVMVTYTNGIGLCQIWFEEGQIELTMSAMKIRL